MSYLRHQTTIESNRDPQSRERDPGEAGPSGVKPAVPRKVPIEPENSSEEEVFHGFQQTPARDARSPGPSGQSNRPVADAQEAKSSDSDASSTKANRGWSSPISQPSLDSDQGIEMSEHEGDTSDEASTIPGYQRRWEMEMVEHNLREGLPKVDPSTVAGPSEQPASLKKGMASELAENRFISAAHGEAAAVENTPAAVQSQLAVNETTEYAGSSQPLSRFNSGGSDYSNPSSETERTVRETIGKKAFFFKIFPTDGHFLQSTTIFLLFFLQRNTIRIWSWKP